MDGVDIAGSLGEMEFIDLDTNLATTYLIAYLITDGSINRICMW